MYHVHIVCNRMQKSKESKAFTLIELLVVVGIIGLLSSVVLVAVFSGRSRARDGRRKADVKQIQGALELYANANNGQYPVNEPTPACGAGGTVSGAVAVAKGCASNVCIKLAPTYVPAFPQTQPGAAAYLYASNGLCYKIKAALENPGDSDADNDGGVDVNAFELFGGPAQSWTM